jgi:hypothetical protein
VLDLMVLIVEVFLIIYFGGLVMEAMRYMIIALGLGLYGEDGCN